MACRQTGVRRMTRRGWIRPRRRGSSLRPRIFRQRNLLFSPGISTSTCTLKSVFLFVSYEAILPYFRLSRDCCTAGNVEIKIELLVVGGKLTWKRISSNRKMLHVCACRDHTTMKFSPQNWKQQCQQALPRWITLTILLATNCWASFIRMSHTKWVPLSFFWM